MRFVLGIRGECGMSTGDLFADLRTLKRDSDSTAVQPLFNAACAQLVRLVQRPSREDLERFFADARTALHSLSALDPEEQNWRSGFWVGQLTALVEIAQAAGFQKVPDPVLSAIRDSELKRKIVSTLCAHGRLRVTDL